MAGSRSPVDISTRLRRIARKARNAPDLVFTSLNHHVDLALLREAFRRVRKDGATGIDNRTAADYAADLEASLQSLLDRFKSGRYRAPPVRRVHIPKGDGTKTRPIGIPTIEDKVLQTAVSMVLGAIYEEDFLDCSYGFRPNRSAHQMLEELWQRLMSMGGGWVLDVDVESFFDSLDHAALRDILDLRIRDGVLRRAIGKWLNAGVMEDGNVTRLQKGTPQGGVISPLLANIFLHEVLDVWFDQEVVPRLSGRAFLLRFADDFVIVFSDERDALRVQSALAQRLAKYGLALHPDKTKLIHFRRPRRNDSGKSNRLPPGSFELLGFVHYWARSRKGRWVVKRKTAPARFTRMRRHLAIWLQRNRHRTVRDQHRVLSKKLSGWFEYHGITGNSSALTAMKYQAHRLWRKWLDRRSQRGRMTWDRFNRLLERYPLPRAVCRHSTYRQVANP